MTPVLSGRYADTRDVLRAERDALKVDHARAGAWLVGAWALPQDFSEICEHHHDAPSVGDSEILQLVKAACNIADAIGFPAVQLQPQPLYPEAASPLTPRLGRHAVRTAQDLQAHVAARLKAFEN